MASDVRELISTLSQAQSLAERLSEGPADEPPGAGYLADADTSGVHAAIDAIARHEGDISIFVGAGVSMEAGLPSWEQLVTRLLRAVVAEQLDASQLDLWLRRTLAEGPLAAAAIAKALHGGDEDKFRIALRDALYAPYGPDAYGPAALAGQIAWLKTKLGGRLRLLTVNYDGLLEAALADAGLEAEPYVKAQSEPSDKAAVWHLHGRLMRRSRSTNWRTTGKLVLAEGDYVRSTYGTFPQDWVADCLETTLCVFVGLSMTDPNLIRWLYAQGSEAPHPRFAVFVRQGSAVPDPEVRAMLERAAARRWRLSGVTPVWTNYYGEVAQMLHEVGLLIDDRDAEPFAWRAQRRLQAARSVVLPDNEAAFTRAQDFLVDLLGELLADVRVVAADAGVDLTAHDLGLGLWAVDHAQGVVELWAVSNRALRDRTAIDRRPMHFDSRWIAVAAVIAGAPVEQDPAVYTSRWRFVRGIPLIVEPTAARSVAGALTLTSTVTMTDNPLARRNAPPELLRAIDRLLVDGAAELFQ
jgi:hypothetical protein